MQNYELIRTLGNGAFGTVTKCLDKQTGEIVAIKVLKEPCTNFQQSLDLKEIKSLRQIKSDNVIKLLKIFRDNNKLYLVFELLDKSLLNMIESRKSPFSDEEVKFIIQQALNGLKSIHKQGFFHRDIKPDNLLFSSNNVLKIADFGLAREIRSRPPFTDYLGTRWYRAPEQLLHSDIYNSPIDIWALGAIMAELYLLKPLFPGTSSTDQLLKILSILGTPNDWPDFHKLSMKSKMNFPFYPQSNFDSIFPSASPESRDLMKKMLTFDPLKRPSAEELLKHDFFVGNEKKSSTVFPHAHSYLVDNSKLPSLQNIPSDIFNLSKFSGRLESPFSDIYNFRNNSPVFGGIKWKQDSQDKKINVVQPQPQPHFQQQPPPAKVFRFHLPGIKKY